MKKFLLLICIIISSQLQAQIEFEKGYRAIIPNARSLEEACAKAEEILKPKPGEKFIAFNVVENVNVRFS